MLGFCCPAGCHSPQAAKKAEIPPSLWFTSSKVFETTQSEHSSLLEEHKSCTESLHTPGCDGEHPKPDQVLSSRHWRGSPGNQSVSELLAVPGKHTDTQTGTAGLAVCADTCSEDLGRSSPVSTCDITLLFSFSTADFNWLFFKLFIFSSPWCDSNTRLRRSFRGRICSVLGWLEPSVKLQAGLCFRSQPTHRTQCVDVLHKAEASVLVCSELHTAGRTQGMFFCVSGHKWVLLFTLRLIKTSETAGNSPPGLDGAALQTAQMPGGRMELDINVWSRDGIQAHILSSVHQSDILTGDEGVERGISSAQGSECPIPGRVPHVWSPLCGGCGAPNFLLLSIHIPAVHPALCACRSVSVEVLSGPWQLWHCRAQLSRRAAAFNAGRGTEKFLSPF